MFQTVMQAGWRQLLQENGNQGYLAPFDYLIILGIVGLTMLIGVVVYRMLLNGWISKLKHPFNLRLISIALFIALAVILVSIYVVNVLDDGSSDSQNFLFPIIVMLVFIIFVIIVNIWGKKVPKA